MPTLILFCILPLLAVMWVQLPVHSICLVYTLMPYAILFFSCFVVLYYGGLFQPQDPTSKLLCRHTGWWRGGHLAQGLVAANVLLDPPSSLMFSDLHFCHHNCIESVFLLLIYPVLRITSIACLSDLGEGSLLCCSSWCFFHFFPVKEFFWEGTVPYSIRRSEDTRCRML